MDKSNITRNLYFGLFISVGIIISSIIITNNMLEIKSENQKIIVKGFSEKIIKSDFGVWKCNIRNSSVDMVFAYNGLNEDIQTTKEYIKSIGFSDDEISTASINTQKIFKRNSEGRFTNEILGYELTQIITVSSDKVDLLKKLSNDATSLIEKGIEIYSYSPEYFYTKLNDLKIEMLGLATRDAKNRANQMAENSDSEVGKIKSARQGVFQITPKNSVDVSDYGEYDLSTIEKSIKAVVTVEFSIK